MKNRDLLKGFLGYTRETKKDFAEECEISLELLDKLLNEDEFIPNLYLAIKLELATGIYRNRWLS
jgi:hypothetical protein